MQVAALFREEGGRLFFIHACALLPHHFQKSSLPDKQSINILPDKY